MPAQPVDVGNTVPDQVFPVIDPEPELPGRSIESGHRQIGVPKGRLGDRERIDRVGLAVGARGISGMGHQLGGDPHQLLSGCEQVRLQAPGQVPAVLDREATLRPEPIGPPQELEVGLRRRGGGALLTELATDLVDRHRRVCSFVCVDAHDHHGRVPFSSKGKRNRSVGTPQWGRSHAHIKPRRPVSSSVASRVSSESQSGGPQENSPRGRRTEAPSQHRSRHYRDDGSGVRVAAMWMSSSSDIPIASSSTCVPSRCSRTFVRGGLVVRSSPTSKSARWVSS